MKKLLIIGIVLLLYTLSVKSQIQLGLKGGYNYFWILSSNESDPHNQTVFQPKENSYSRQLLCLILFYQPQTYRALLLGYPKISVSLHYEYTRPYTLSCFYSS